MNKRRSSSTSGDKTEYLDRIPLDLFISNILSRLPVKSLAQCRCVSKLWSSLIRSPNYNLLFPIKSPAPPRILFIINKVFYSSPQPHNPDENTSLVATLHHRTRGSLYSVCRPPVGGLVCHQHLQHNNSTMAVVSNPITGECLALPKLRMDDEVKNKARESYSFAYDPIKNRFKILSITSLCDTKKFGQYQVLTLGTGNENLLWRNIHCSTIHYRLGNENMICINGVLYYPAVIYDDKGDPSLTMACFDCRSETFSFINIDKDMSGKMSFSISLTLIDYKGQLGVCYCDIFSNIFKLWVLEDAQIHKWSKHIYQMPHSWWLPEMIYVRAAGMVGSGDIALYPCYLVDPFIILYYNLESNIITRVILEVPRLLSGCWVYAFTNYVEDMKLM